MSKETKRERDLRKKLRIEFPRNIVNRLMVFLKREEIIGDPPPPADFAWRELRRIG